MIAVRVLAQTTLAALISGLSACGGGGSGGGDQTVTLVVSFSYLDTQGDVRAPVQSQPSITGLQGHASVCTLTGGALPPGVSLASASCVLSGTPTAVGRYQAAVTLTSPGVQGSVAATGNFVVVDPTPTLVKAPGVGPSGPLLTDLSLQYAAPFGAHATVALAPASYTSRPGDSVAYAVTGGTLPGGLVFDPASASVQGTPTGFGVSTVQIAATLTRAGVAYTSAPTGISLGVSTVALRVSYPAVCLVPFATAFTCVPIFDTQDVLTGLTLSFTATGLPTGVSINADTGVVSGVLSTVGSTPVAVGVRGVYPDGSVQTTSAGANLQSGGTFPFYDPSGSDFGLAAGPGPDPRGIYGWTARIIPGAAFGIDLTGYNVVIPGDVHTFALQPYDAVTPLPPWISVDPATGRLSGIAPNGTAPGFWSVQVTTLRNGTTFVANVPWIVTLIP